MVARPSQATLERCRDVLEDQSDLERPWRACRIWVVASPGEQNEELVIGIAVAAARAVTRKITDDDARDGAARLDERVGEHVEILALAD